MCDKINTAGAIRTNCSDKMSNLEQLYVLNEPVLTAEHDNHMDGPHWDLRFGKGPNPHISRRETEMNREVVKVSGGELQDEADIV